MSKGLLFIEEILVFRLHLSEAFLAVVECPARNSVTWLVVVEVEARIAFGLFLQQVCNLRLLELARTLFAILRRSAILAG